MKFNRYLLYILICLKNVMYISIMTFTSGEKEPIP